MSLEYALERFPLKVALRDGTNCANRAMEQLGFCELIRLPDYVMDMQSRLHDYVVLAKQLRGEEEFAGVG